MQMSAHLRNTLTPLPRDRIAFSASLLLKMMSDWANPTEVQRKMMAGVLASIQWKNQSDKAKMAVDSEGFGFKCTQCSYSSQSGRNMRNHIESRHASSFGVSAACVGKSVPPGKP